MQMTLKSYVSPPDPAWSTQWFLAGQAGIWNWEWFKNESPPKDSGYTYWQDPNVKKISDGLEVNDHSGATFGYCMRQMQFIAKHGFDKWNHIIDHPE